MIKEAGELMNRLENLENLLKEYNTLTGSLLSVNFEETEQTDKILSDREVIIKRIREVYPTITSIIDLQDEQDSLSIKKMLSGQASVSKLSISEEKKELLSKIIDIRSLQIKIVKMDKEFATRLKLKRDEIHSELIDLQKEKKKINFYNNASISTKGQTYDSQN